MKLWFSKKTPIAVDTALPDEKDGAVHTQLEMAQALQRKANALRSQGDLAAALQSYQAAMATHPSYMPARLGAGLICFDQQNYRAASVFFEEAHRLEPNAVDPLYFLAQCDEMSGKFLQALKAYESVLQTEASFVPALRALAPLALRFGRTELALSALQSAVNASTQDVELHLLFGITLYAAGRNEESLREFDFVLDADPSRLEALINKAEALFALERPNEAKAIVDRLDQLAPQRTEVMLLSARTLFNSDRAEEAAVKARQLLALDPRCAMAEFVLGLVCWSKSDKASAKHHYERAFALDPDLAIAGLWLATLLFFEKNYQAAWPAYEARFGSSFGSVSVDSLLLRRLSRTRRWSGDAQPGGTLYIWSEQGLGDTLMFLPLVRQAAERFEGTVYFYCPPQLRELAEQFVAARFLLASRNDIPDGVLHCPLYSVPAVLQHVTHTPFRPQARGAYLRAPQAALARFHDRLKRLDGFKIGIVWNGSAGYKANFLRNVPLSIFADIARIPQVTLVSLQKDPPPADLAACTFQLIDWTDEIRDFSDTAAIMQGLDLVISIDSAPAHLAGALGVPVWLLNRHEGEWRWGRARSDNDWYQSMRVFYQSTRADWAPVFSEMSVELQHLLAEKLKINRAD